MFIANNRLVVVRKKEDLKEQRRPCERCKSLIRCGDVYVLLEEPTSFGNPHRIYYHWSCYAQECDELVGAVAAALGVPVNELSSV